MESFLLPCVATGVPPLAVARLSGTTPRGQPWASAVTLPLGRKGLNARRLAVLSPFRAPSLDRHVHHELLRSAVLDVTPIIPATACHQRNDVERYRRSKLATSYTIHGAFRVSSADTAVATLRERLDSLSCRAFLP